MYINGATSNSGVREEWRHVERRLVFDPSIYLNECRNAVETSSRAHMLLPAEKDSVEAEARKRCIEKRREYLPDISGREEIFNVYDVKFGAHHLPSVALQIPELCEKQVRSLRQILPISKAHILLAAEKGFN